MLDLLRLDTGTEHVVVELTQVEEVLPMVQLDHVGERRSKERHERGFCGLLRYRGRVVPVHQLPGAVDVAGDVDAMIVVLRPAATSWLALMVQDVLEVLRVSHSARHRSHAGGVTVVDVGGELLRLVEAGEL